MYEHGWQSWSPEASAARLAGVAVAPIPPVAFEVPEIVRVTEPTSAATDPAESAAESGGEDVSLR